MERQWDGRDAVQRLYRVMQQIRRCPANRDAMELSIGENGLLCCLSKHADGVTASELKRMTGIGASGVTNLMNALERKGLIRREMNPSDRRSVLVTISDAGRASSGCWAACSSQYFLPLGTSLGQPGCAQG